MGIIRVTIKAFSRDNFDIEIDGNLPISELKAKIEAQCQILSQHMRLIYKGRVLSDNCSIGRYGVIDGDTIHLIRIALPNGTGNNSNTNAVSNAQAPSLFPGMPPGMDPNMVANAMNSPMVNTLLDNPDLIRPMLLSCPRLRRMLELNPQLSSQLSDPQLLRQVIMSARNPQVLQEVMRNQDRVMANIESMPGGYNALQRMYRDVLEPAEESFAEASTPIEENFEISSSAHNLNSTQGYEGAPLPNPWTSQPTNSESQPTQIPGDTNSTSNDFFRVNPSEGLAGIPANELNRLLSGITGNSSSASNYENGGLDQNLLFQNWGNRQNVVGNSNDSTIESTESAEFALPSLDGPNPWAPTSSEKSPENRYRAELERLESMGFSDRQNNIQVLMRNQGDVDKALEALIEQIDQ